MFLCFLGNENYLIHLVVTCTFLCCSLVGFCQTESVAIQLEVDHQIQANKYLVYAKITNPTNKTVSISTNFLENSTNPSSHYWHAFVFNDKGDTLVDNKIIRYTRPSYRRIAPHQSIKVPFYVDFSELVSSFSPTSSPIQQGNYRLQLVYTNKNQHGRKKVLVNSEEVVLVYSL